MMRAMKSRKRMTIKTILKRSKRLNTNPSVKERALKGIELQL
jgi:hypothetical protein